MSAAVTLAERISDRLNPIVVKELRQAVQSRFVSVAILVFLAIQVCVIGGFLVFDEDLAKDFEGGARVFAVLQGFLTASCILFVPTYTGIRLAAERARVDLMFVSAIRPWAIVRGKFLAATMLTLLLFAICMPFMTFTYLLRGIDLPSIFLILAISFGIVLHFTQVAILWGSLPSNLVVVILLGVVLAVGLVFWAIYGGVWLALAVGLGIGSQIWDARFWAIAATVLFVGAAAIGLNMSYSVAMLSPLSSNRMLPVRICITAIWLLSAAVAGVWSYAYSAAEPLAFWCSYAINILAFSMVVAVCERDQWGPRVARQIPANPLLRLFAFPFFTGWAGGLIWCTILIVLTLIGPLLVAKAAGFGRGYGDLEEAVESIAGIALYVYAYSMTALLLRRHFFRKWLKCGLTWLLALALLFVGVVLPLLAYFLLHYEEMSHIGDEGIWLVGNPIAFLLVPNDYQEKCFLFVGIWSGLVFLLSLPAAIGRLAAFKPPAPSPPAVEGATFPAGPPADDC